MDDMKSLKNELNSAKPARSRKVTIKEYTVNDNKVRKKIMNDRSRRQQPTIWRWTRKQRELRTEMFWGRYIPSQESSVKIRNLASVRRDRNINEILSYWRTTNERNSRFEELFVIHKQCKCIDDNGSMAMTTINYGFIHKSQPHYQFRNRNNKLELGLNTRGNSTTRWVQIRWSRRYSKMSTDWHSVPFGIGGIKDIKDANENQTIAK